MAFDMAEHLSQTQLERFAIGRLAEAEPIVMANHLATCDTCHQGLAETLKRHRGSEGISFTLAPEFWLKHEHLDYEQLSALADNKLDATEREIIDTHLTICAPCREDVSSFLAFRKQIEPEMRVRYWPITIKPGRNASATWGWLRGLAGKPAYAIAIVVIGIALVAGVAIFLKRRADNFQAKQAPSPTVNPVAPGETPTPDNRAANSPSPALPNQSAWENPNNSGALIALNDQTRVVTVDKQGKLSGLDEVPASTRDEVAKAMKSERIERAAVLKDLDVEESALRGSNRGQSFKLISPARTVIVSDRPTFRWENVSGASSYRVYVLDSDGRGAAKSEELSPEHTEWPVPRALKRGEIYAWSVIAVVDGKEIISPNTSSPEMKFQILSNGSLQQLNSLKRTRSHLALGIFYARVGMDREAEREFKALLRLNPESKVATNLLRSIRSTPTGR